MSISVKIAEKGSTAQLKRLWLACFDEESEALDLFFEHCFADTAVYAAYDGSSVVAAVYLAQCSLNGKRSHYLCGAATLPNYRKQGIMSGLIEYALAEAQRNGDVYSLLFPANDRMYSYYQKLGYITCYAESVTVSRQSLNKTADNSKTLKKLNFEEMQKNYFLQDFVLWKNDYINFAADYNKIYGAKVIRGSQCIAFFDKNDTAAEVFYSMACNENELAALLIENSDATQFRFIKKSDEYKHHSIKYGMIKLLDNKYKLPQNAFLGITLS